jgi:hypothetical protein
MVVGRDDAGSLDRGSRFARKAKARYTFAWPFGRWSHSKGLDFTSSMINLKSSEATCPHDFRFCIAMFGLLEGY